MSIPNSTFTCSKSFKDYPCCHRQWKHSGHCRFIHGYSRSFTFWFAATNLEENGFVVDFSSLRELEAKLKNHFDHTFLINEDDPMRSLFEKHDGDLWDLTIMPNVGMEASSKYIFDHVNPMIEEMTEGRCWVVSVECRENVKNSAIYTNERPYLTIKEG